MAPRSQKFAGSHSHSQFPTDNLLGPGMDHCFLCEEEMENLTFFGNNPKLKKVLKQMNAEKGNTVLKHPNISLF